MRVFVTGATGFIGSAIVAELLGAGHRVVGLARSDAAAAALAAAGAEVHRGALDDLDSLRRGAAAADGVIHAAFVHDDFTRLAAAGETDGAAVEALGAALAGSGRPLVVTSAIPVLAPGRVGVEADPPVAGSVGAHRVPGERAARAQAAAGVRVSVLRLPPTVHGDGDHAFVPALIRIARERGASAYIGDGHNRWPAVHRLDAAALYRLALEHGAAGATYHAIAEEGIPARELAEAIGRLLGVPVVSTPLAAAADHFAWLARFFALDIPASSAWTQRELGWRPRHPGLLDDLAHGRYVPA